MGTDATILLGAVAYDPKVVTIWEGIREHFIDRKLPLDFALFSNYERQVKELLAGHIDVAWNTPLAHVRVRRRDRGIRSLADLQGRTLAAGGADPRAVALGHQRFTDLLAGMHEGRVKRLQSAGFTPGQAGEISGLHTPNFM